jgi:hypothetical protein
MFKWWDFIHPALINLKKGTNQYDDLKPLCFVGQKQLNFVVLIIDFRCPTFDIVLTLISCVFFFFTCMVLYMK